MGGLTGGGGRDWRAGRSCAVLSMRKWQGQVRFEINLHDETVELLAASSAEACIFSIFFAHHFSRVFFFEDLKYSQTKNGTVVR